MGRRGCWARCRFSLWSLWRELEKIRGLRSHGKEIERREAERASQVNWLKEGLKGTWKPDANLDGFREPSPPGFQRGLTL